MGVVSHRDETPLEAAVDTYHAAYLRSFPAGGDAQDHSEAVEEGVAAIMELFGVGQGEPGVKCLGCGSSVGRSHASTCEYARNQPVNRMQTRIEPIEDVRSEARREERADLRIRMEGDARAALLRTLEESDRYYVRMVAAEGALNRLSEAVNGTLRKWDETTPPEG